MVTQNARAAGPEVVTQDAAAAGPELPSPPVTERPARFLPGLPMLALGIVLLLAGVVLIVLANHQQRRGRYGADLARRPGLCRRRPRAGRARPPSCPARPRVVQLFGKYRGTIREPGLQWVNPFTKRIVVSTRIRNQESAQAKVNDADGNPIEIAAVVVWQVAGHRQRHLFRR